MSFINSNQIDTCSLKRTTELYNSVPIVPVHFQYKKGNFHRWAFIFSNQCQQWFAYYDVQFLYSFLKLSVEFMGHPNPYSICTTRNNYLDHHLFPFQTVFGIELLDRLGFKKMFAGRQIFSAAISWASSAWLTGMSRNITGITQWILIVIRYTAVGFSCGTDWSRSVATRGCLLRVRQKKVAEIIIVISPICCHWQKLHLLTSLSVQARHVCYQIFLLKSFPINSL